MGWLSSVFSGLVPTPQAVTVQATPAVAGVSTSGTTGKATKGGVKEAPEPYLCPCCAIVDKHVVLKKGHKCMHKSKQEELQVAGARAINTTRHGFRAKLYVKNMTESGVALKWSMEASAAYPNGIV